jgi:hypothetical protein
MRAVGHNRIIRTCCLQKLNGRLLFATCRTIEFGKSANPALQPAA